MKNVFTTVAAITIRKNHCSLVRYYVTKILFLSYLYFTNNGG